jgi:hypothetical protein
VPQGRPAGGWPSSPAGALLFTLIVNPQHDRSSPPGSSCMRNSPSLQAHLA